MWDLFITAAVRTVIIFLIIAGVVGLAVGLASAIIATYNWIGWVGVIIIIVIVIFIVVLISTYLEFH